MPQPSHAATARATGLLGSLEIRPLILVTEHGLRSPTLGCYFWNACSLNSAFPSISRLPDVLCVIRLIEKGGGKMGGNREFSSWDLKAVEEESGTGQGCQRVAHRDPPMA